MQLDQLIGLLDKTPVIADIHPVSVCYLPDDIKVFATARELLFEMDNPSPMLSVRALVIASNDDHTDRIPRVICDHDPFTPAMNDILFDRYQYVAQNMLCQSQIAQRIVEDIGDSSDPETIILFLVDGLSYHHMVHFIVTDQCGTKIEPCLVDVPTFTSLAFPNIINDPPLALRLFDGGYQDGFGASYWTRDNTLTDVLFRTIPRVQKIGDFHAILARVEGILAEQQDQKTYIQILRTGLDGYAHHQKRQPPITEIVRQIYLEFESLAEVCNRAGCNAHLYLTSDHGILWRGEFEGVVVGNAQGKSSSRWCTWKDLYQQSDVGMRFVVDQQEYYCLGFPKLRRPLHIDEQGVHGGISFQESIVPFVTKRLTNHA